MIIPIPVYSDDCHIRIKRDCLELYFSDLVPDDQLVYEFTDEAECCQRVEFEVAAGEVASIRICGISDLCGTMTESCDRCANLEERISELEELLLLARGDVTDLEARVVSEEAMHRLEVERLTGGSEE